MLWGKGGGLCDQLSKVTKDMMILLTRNFFFVVLFSKQKAKKILDSPLV